MKKISAFILALLMALSLCACGGTDGGSKDDGKKDDGKASYTPDYGELYFKAGDISFGVMDYADELIDTLGEHTNFESESCAYQGKDYFYYYDGFDVTVNEIDGQMRITGVTLTDDTVQNPQGVKIGMQLDKALELMGDDFTQNGAVYRYTCGSTVLLIQLGDDGTVNAINYTTAVKESAPAN